MKDELKMRVSCMKVVDAVALEWPVSAKELYDYISFVANERMRLYDLSVTNSIELDQLRQQLTALQAECEEQARLNGIGSEREAALLAKLEAAEDEATAAEILATDRLQRAEQAEAERDSLREYHRQAEMFQKFVIGEGAWERFQELTARTEQAIAERDLAVKDSERLDYIERTFSGMTSRERYLPVMMIWGKGCNGRTLREACDKYMNRDAAIAIGDEIVVEVIAVTGQQIKIGIEAPDDVTVLREELLP